MDDYAFDRLARAFDHGLSRRRLGGVFATLSLSAAMPAPVAAKRKRGKKRKKNKKKQPPPTCTPNCAGKACGASDDCGGTCATGSCPSGVCQDGVCQGGGGGGGGGGGCGAGGNCLVFATSQTYAGNLGGLAGADQKCNTLAQAAGLPGTYRAWLSDSTGSPSSRFVQSTGPYVLVTGERIADNWADLTNNEPIYELDHEINRDERGVEITPADTYRYTWTNTKPDGTLNVADHHCQNWSTNQGTPNFGSAGNVNATDSFWTYATSIFCNNPGQRLYCFQQS